MTFLIIEKTFANTLYIALWVRWFSKLEQLFGSSQNPLADFVLKSNLQNRKAVFAKC